LTTQYCDRVRGPMVVYDPNGPHANLYDVEGDIYFLKHSLLLKPQPQRSLSSF
ncbi:hypothetical protein K435DRAFT_661460, partial [Dendrothele bispora CBS 962.96]